MATVKKRKEPLTNDQAVQKLAEWLRPQVLVRNGHCCLLQSDKRTILTINGVRYSPLQAAYFVTHGVPFDPKVCDYRQSPLCQEKGCLQHRLLCRYGVNSIEDATADEKQNARDYLMKHTKADGECLLWTAGLHKNGYGKCTDHFGYEAAHKLAWAVYHGRSVPAGDVLRHRCPHRHNHCLAQKHLDVGTQLKNIHDMLEDGTMKVGEQHHNARLTEAQVREIKASYGKGTQEQRGAPFGVTGKMVSRIDNCEVWKHLWTQADRDEAARRKRRRPTYSLDLIQQIMDSKDDGTTQAARAIRFKVSQAQVSLIDRGKRNTKTAQERKDDDKPRYYAKMRLRIRSRCKLERSPDGKDHCWIFQGRKNGDYGSQSLYHIPRLAHNVSWLVNSKEQHCEVPKGEDGKRLQVRHRCNVPLCCNPEHLELGTPEQNSDDRRRAGTLPEGADHYRAKLTDEQVQEIRASSKTPKELAAYFHVSYSAILSILNRKSYRNVP